MNSREQMVYIEIENKSATRSMLRGSPAKADELFVQIHSDELNFEPTRDVAQDVHRVVRDMPSEGIDDVWRKQVGTDAKVPRSGNNLADYSAVEFSFEWMERLTLDEMKTAAKSLKEEIDASFDSHVSVRIDEEPWEMYYCKECDKEHQTTSRIGNKHKKYRRE